MASAGWFRGRSFELIHTRSVLVNVNPTPTTLSERRAVLRALQRHGTVEVFKRLPAPSSFICAFVKRKEAVDTLHKSPLTFKFISEPFESIPSHSTPGLNPVDVAAPIEVHFVEGESETTKRDQTYPSTAEIDPIKTFTLWVKPSESRYNHKTNIRRNPIHGPWPEVKKSDHDFAYYALKQVIPESIAQHTLCDWVTGGQLSEDVKLARADEENSGTWQIRDRIERRRNREKASADVHELTSWTSIKSALQPHNDPFTEAFESELGSVNEPTDKPVDEKSSEETVSEPLRLDNPQSQALDPLQVRLGGKNSLSDQAPESDHPRNHDDSMTTSANKEILQKILQMPTLSRATPVLESGLDSLESLRSEPSDHSEKQQKPLDHGKDT